MHIGIVSGKKQHYHDLVRELERAGDLAHFWAGRCYLDAPTQPWAQRRLAALVRRRWPRKYRTFLLEGVAAERVSTQPWTSLAAAALNRLGGQGGWGNVLHNALFDRWAARRIARHNAPLDLLHLCNSHALHTGRAAHRRGLPVVFDHGAAHRGFEHDLVAPEFRRVGHRSAGGSEARQIAKQERELAQADFLVCPSEFARRSFIERGFPASRTFVCPYGVDAEPFRAAAAAARDRGAPADDVFRVLFIGGDQIRKGVPYLIDAMDRLALPDSELVLVAPNARQIALRLARATCRVRHIEFLARDELAPLAASCSVFCMPSLSDGFGMVVTEAMAAGLPAIVSTNVGAPVRDGVEGYVVPIRDADAIADRLALLHRDADLRRRLGAAAAEAAAAQTWARYAETLRAAYAEMLRLWGSPTGSPSAGPAAPRASTNTGTPGASPGTA